MARKIVIGSAIAGLVLAGAAGVALPQTADAATGSTSSPSASATATEKGHYNTDPAHEAGESAERKAEAAKNDATASPAPTNG